jgi:hypothetical protein
MFYYKTNITLLLLLLCMVFVLYSLKDLDKKIIEARKKENEREKDKIIQWIRQKYKFNHSTQYKELSQILINASQRYKWKFNMYSLVVLFIPIWSGVSITRIRNDPNSTTLVLLIAAILTILGIYGGYLARTMLEDLLDSKHNKIIQAARFMAETSIELSIKENRKKRSRLNGR